MSKKYFTTEWDVFKEPLRKAIPKQSDGKLIILFLEDVTSVDDPELMHYIQTCPTIRWGAAGFLNKLRFFLPEPASLTFQRNVTLRTLRSAPSEAPLQFVPTLGREVDILRKKKLDEC